MTDVNLKIDGLDKIIKALKAKPIMARVGILGNSNAREGKAKSNATVGAAHEFGTTTMPMRSFLRIPIAEHLGKNLENSGAFTKDALETVVKQKSLKPWVEKVAIEAEGIVADAFDTGGFGQWAPLSEKTMSRKKVKQILVETQQLRNSITSEVVEG